MGLREAQKDKGKDFIIHDDGNNVYEEVVYNYGYLALLYYNTSFIVLNYSFLI